MQHWHHYLLVVLLLWGIPQASLHAEEIRYRVDIEAPDSLDSLLRKHLDIVKALDNPRLNRNEWLRLLGEAEQDAQSILATEGYFSPQIDIETDQQDTLSHASFKVEPGPQTTVAEVEIEFTGAIHLEDEHSRVNKLKENWALQVGAPFSQDNWDKAKRTLLSDLIAYRYPEAHILHSEARIQRERNQVKLRIEIDSGPVYRFGSTRIEGVQRYDAAIIERLNPIKPGDIYDQNSLLRLQTLILESGYYQSVEVSADTENGPLDAAPVIVKVSERKASTLSTGAGLSTNTGARVQLNYEDLDVFGLDWRFVGSFKVEQLAQSLNGQLQRPQTENGFRDSLSSTVGRTAIEGQTTTVFNNSLKRAWGPRRFEQFVGTGILFEQVDLDGAESSNKQVATVSYGITLRRVDNELSPNRGYLLNAQVAAAPLDSLSDGKFVQTYVKGQAYWPLAERTQLITRLEIGAVNGGNAPATYLFRAGGDQSVRGYAFQSLGNREGDAIAGARYLLTGSAELVQWLTREWGGAVFVDFGNAADTIKTLKPVYAYGLGVRWKSPAGPIGADIAYGQDTGEFRLHFNLGVSF